MRYITHTIHTVHHTLYYERTLQTAPTVKQYRNRNIAKITLSLRRIALLDTPLSLKTDPTPTEIQGPYDTVTQWFRLCDPVHHQIGQSSAHGYLRRPNLYVCMYVWTME